MQSNFKLKAWSLAASAVFSVTCATAAMAGDAPTAATVAANQAVLEALPFDDTRDFDDVKRGFIAPLPNDGVIRSADGAAVYDLSAFGFAAKGAAPDTVNPSLWRQTQLQSFGGLFEVAPRIYQVRSADISNPTFIEGDTGVIVIDPVTTVETGKVAIDLYRQHRGNKPVVAVIYTHSHIDHFGGVRGMVDEADVKAGKVRIIAPVGFMEEVAGENVNVGNHMSRRATYQFGNLLPKGPEASLGSGLGLTAPAGTMTMIPPTDLVTSNDQTMTIDGLTFEFLLAPSTEAPAEMHFFIRELKALTAAENVNHTMHNLYTLRGAKPRNGQAWAKAINMTLERWGDRAELLYGPHTWPTWGHDRVVEMLEKQRDLYKYVTDQTLRLANHGYNMTEAAEQMKLPQELGQYWPNRGYYGTVEHGSKGVWAYSLGWFDGNPAGLNPLPEAAASRKYVEYMGGVKKALAAAQKDFDAGSYRWVAEVINHVVNADPANAAARELLAKTYTQLGYQAESAIWRNFYLSGAQELRDGVKKGPAPNTGAPDLMRALSVEQLFDALAIRVNGPKASGHRLAINFHVTDSHEDHALVLENAVLNTMRPVARPDLSLTLPRQALFGLMMGKVALPDLVKAGTAKIEGDPAKLAELAGLLDTFDFWWDVATPRTEPKG